MKLEYEGYILETEEVYQEGERRIVANCDKIGYAVNTSEGYDKVITRFRRLVNEYIHLWRETVNTAEPCLRLVQKKINDTPESVSKPFQVLLDFKYRTEEGISEKDKEKKPRPKVTLRYGDSIVNLVIIQGYDGSYICTPRSNVASVIVFSSIKGAVLFFSEFIPIDPSDGIEVFLEYKDNSISFYMTSEDRTKVVWVNYTDKNKGFNDFQLRGKKVNNKVNNSVDDTFRDFIKWVDREYLSSDFL